MPDEESAALRELRRRCGVSQRVVARLAGVSVGHVSRVEAGERPLSPAVVNGYEKALGARLTHVASQQTRDTLETTPGEDADEMRRRAFAAAVASIAAGGPLSAPIQRTIASLGQAEAPARVGLADVTAVEHLEGMFTTWDLCLGGGLAREMAGTQLRWATGLLDAAMSDRVRVRLNRAVGSLAERAAWSSFDAGRQESARSLFKVALYCATEADDADLRAHILSDIATQQLYLGDPDQCLKIIRLAAGDDRIGPAVRFALHGVRARAFGARGEAEHCARQIGLAESAYGEVTPDLTPPWMTGFLTQAHVYSVTGQAAYSLARATDRFSDDAHSRLSGAVTGFGAGRARAVALCATRLATLHLRAGSRAEGAAAARAALRALPGLRSARITRDLTIMRDAVGRSTDDARRLGEEISATITLTP